jgi:hypothetical protein
VASSGLFRKRIAVPQEHGSWAFFLAPLLVGLVAGGRLRVAAAYLVVAATTAFLARQPLLALVKVRSGRRPASDVPAACFWLALYAAVCALHVLGLVLRGYGFVLHLAVPGALVAGWHLALVGRRAERRKLLLDVLAVGGLALSAPAGLWIGHDAYEPLGWLLWALLWAGAVSAVLQAYAQLPPRGRGAADPEATRRRHLRAGLLLAAGVLLVVLGLAAGGVVAWWLAAPFVWQLAVAVQGARRPARREAPRAVGFRQLVALVVFTVLFALAWRAGA